MEIKRVGHTHLLGPSNQILQDWEGICLTLAPTFTKKQALNPLGSSDAQIQSGGFLLFTPHLAQEGNFSFHCRGLLPPACPSLPPTLAASGGLPRPHPIPSAEPSNRVAGPLPWGLASVFNAVTLHIDKSHALVLCWQWQLTMSLKVWAPDWPARNKHLFQHPPHPPPPGSFSVPSWPYTESSSCCGPVSSDCTPTLHRIIKTYLQTFHSAPVIRSKDPFIKRDYS